MFGFRQCKGHRHTVTVRTYCCKHCWQSHKWLRLTAAVRRAKPFVSVAKFKTILSTLSWTSVFFLLMLLFGKGFFKTDLHSANDKSPSFTTDCFLKRAVLEISPLCLPLMVPALCNSLVIVPFPNTWNTAPALA